ncbi:MULTISPECIES: PTS sugar transporter subunit IIA [unclassified Lactobacillus]|uniref:PTS sugar transporter subunit IIA n=1 Tax=unclassified Lactobacillus TaxID=2620435 RepID=UPI000EFB0B80|nr:MULTISPECIES: PTS sugar transporter subunit IIA [unclassified Lactobacillus]RMC23691.1 PTS sugar transporter subunit IIA [Lactobacillus sp. ESL0247]RMC27451.1 PTS sugar transporter subunit IIA [Lactobacillus sp. ESL0246]RMC30652.1 PTS sugar transporter subunit IIA [Lactobacillus sp. ESL0245]RMC47231.1 PTS sugar transporter subunit IIA [Lactobacillus sp. ESL0228]
MELLNQSLVFARINLNSSDEIIHYLAQQLKKQGKVKDTFEQAVKDREQVHPTGLPSGEIAVAIPHTDIQYVNEAAIAFATLAHPIKFHNMAITNETLEVQIVVMLALKTSHGQVKMLQKLMALFQNQDLLSNLIQLKNNVELYKAISKQI